MKKLKVVVAAVLIIVSFIVLYFITIVIIGVINDYQPDKITELTVVNNSDNNIINDYEFTLLTWNIGFGGLGAEMDFFYDGGKMVKPAAERAEKYLNGVLNYLKSSDTIDFILLQEVDRNSARTRRKNQIEMIRQVLPEYSYSFAVNYKVPYVPLPLFNPLGRIEMGQLNFSRYSPKKSVRYSYSSAYSWPKRFFMLDRCFVVSRYQHENGKELVVINTHNSAYDKKGKLRTIEMPEIKNFMLEEFNNGNHVIAGGDWNQNPPGYKITELDAPYQGVTREFLESSLFPEDWRILYDRKNPTNREINAPFSIDDTEVTIIDFFIVSPNVEVQEIKTMSQKFSFSDHEPVIVKISLNK